MVVSRRVGATFLAHRVYVSDGGSYVTFSYSMQEAAQPNPIFLIIHQFNEFVQPDEGLYENSDDDIEPANLWATILRS